MTDIGQKNNFGKFVLLQHPKYIGTEHDVASVIDSFPLDKATDMPPKVKRDAHEVNGIAVGFSTGRRSDLALEHALTLSDRAKVLQEYLPLIGPQAVAKCSADMCSRHERHSTTSRAA